jgi:hypothetical protein
MPDLNQVSLPSNYFDITSAQLLVQPEPQYLYALLLMSALAADLPIPEDMSLPVPGQSFDSRGQNYATPGTGGLMLSDTIGPQVFAAEVQMDGLPGTTIRLNRPKFTDSTYTKASRLVNADQTISTTSIAINAEQSTLTLQRFAGPYDNTAGEIRPYGIDKFAASRGVHKLSKVSGFHLKRDYVKFLDSWVNATLENATNIIRPVNMAADNDATTKGAFPLDYETIIRTATVMDEAGLPKLSDGRRILVVTPQGAAQLKLDPMWQRLATYHPELNPLFSDSYAGSIAEFHVFKSQTLTTTANTSSVKIHHAHAIAPGALGCGMGGMPRVALNTQTNYGEKALVVWIAYLALELLDERFVRSVRYSESA